MSTKKVHRVSLGEYTILATVAVIGLVVYGSSIERAPLASAETQFVERSVQGLQIVPASCPSSPHYTGECSGVPGEGGSGGSGTGGSGSVPLILPPNPEGSCPVGYTLNNGWCVFYGCPAGYHVAGGQCVAEEESGQCIARYYCVGNDVYRRNAQCVEFGPIEHCAFGCSGGGCLPPPPGSGNITATPTLIRSGERSVIAWTTNDMAEDSCTVTENNPDITDVEDGLNGSFTSSQIRQQTTYTLMCTTVDGDAFVDSVKVNILPVFQES